MTPFKAISIIYLFSVLLTSYSWIIGGAFIHNDDRHAICGAIYAVNYTLAILWARWEWTRKP